MASGVLFCGFHALGFVVIVVSVCVGVGGGGRVIECCSVKKKNISM